jgi:hypothetical protein
MDIQTTIKAVKTTSENPDFVSLIAALDKSLWERYPELKTNYWGNNVIEFNDNVVIIYLEDVPVACGCFRIGTAHITGVRAFSQGARIFDFGFRNLV